jgi:hypothetical protein
MKIKKSELIALIKEEIIKEARFDRGMTMMDDPYDDNEPVPASMQSGGAMDQAFQYILTDVEKSLDFPAGALVNYLVTQNPEASPGAVGKMAVQALEVLGMNFPTERAVEQYISREMDEKELERDDDMMQEGIEGIMDPTNQQLMIDAVEKLAPLVGVMSLPVLVGLLYEKLKAMGAK